MPHEVQPIGFIPRDFDSAIEKQEANLNRILLRVVFDGCIWMILIAPALSRLELIQGQPLRKDFVP